MDTSPSLLDPYVSPVKDEDEDNTYTVHKLGRQLAPAAALPFLYSSAKGQYRINYATYAQQSDRGAFTGWGGAFYKRETLPGKLSQQIFLPKEFQGRPLSKPEIEEVRKSGALAQRYAGMGFQAQLALRMGANLYAISGRNYKEIGGEYGVEDEAIFADTLAVVSNMAEVGTYNVGLNKVSCGQEMAAAPWLEVSHRLNLAGNLFQAGAGALRLSLEGYDYLEEGEFNQSTVAYASMDLAAGAAGAAYSGLVLNQVARASNGASRNSILMHVVEISPRLQWGLRAAGVAGSAFGFGVNAYTYYQARQDRTLTGEEVREIKNISTLGMIGSGFLLAGGLMVTTATAPVAVGVLMTAGIAFLVGQSVYQYRHEIYELFQHTYLSIDL